jgi:DNA primase large subunit
MQASFSRFAKNDYTKYPFLKEAAKYVREPGLRIEDLEDPELSEILRRAEERVEEAILYAMVTRNPRQDEDVEILSFTVAIILALATQNTFIQKRYALAEAKQAYEDMKLEPKEKLEKIAQNFGWELSLNNDRSIPYEYTVNFADYLHNATYLREGKWKLTQRVLSNGRVYIMGNEVARLLEEEVRRYVEKRMEPKDLPKLQGNVLEVTERIKKLAEDRVGKTDVTDFPKVVVQTAFPPCVQALYQAFSSGRHLSHIGRFTLTSFLINIGMPSATVIDLFKNISDFSEKLTRYQVEHIAGERGSGTHYSTPKCDTLKTHGVCVTPDNVCRNVRHPLAYYRKKAASKN